MTTPETQQLERLARAHADAASRFKSAEADVAHFSKRLEEAQEAANAAYHAARVAERDLIGFAAMEFLPPVITEYPEEADNAKL